MATITPLLRKELMSGFFNPITSIRAVVEYSKPGVTVLDFAENTLQSWSMSIAENAGDDEVVAEFVNPAQTSNFIIINLEQGGVQYASAEVKKLQFTNTSGDETYFEWIFDSQEVVYTGNGELHIEEANFKVV